MYNHPVARNFTSASTNPFTASSRSDTPTNTAVYRELAERLQQHDDGEEDDASEEDDEEDIVSYDIRFEQRVVNANNELEQPHADGTWEASIAPQPETESLFHLPFTRFGRLLE
jgi:predicted transposase YdaD